MPIGVGKIARVSAPECLSRRLRDCAAVVFDKSESLIDGGFAFEIDCDGKTAKAASYCVNTGIFGQRLMAIEPEDHAAHIEKGDTISRCVGDNESETFVESA